MRPYDPEDDPADSDARDPEALYHGAVEEEPCGECPECGASLVEATGCILCGWLPAPLAEYDAELDGWL